MIEVSDYSPDWTFRYERARRELLDALPRVILAVEHIGSTAVEGLPAKSVIDIMCAVQSLSAFGRNGPALFRLNYEYYDVGMPRRLFYRRRTGTQWSHHLHVVEISTWDERDERLFRDWLRQHPALRDEYGELKRRLALTVRDVYEYTRAKTELVQRVVDAARCDKGLPPVDVWEGD